jgi:hypothetical protein
VDPKGSTKWNRRKCQKIHTTFCSFIFRYTASTVRACKDTFNSSHDRVHPCCCGAVGLEIFEEEVILTFFLIRISLIQYFFGLHFFKKKEREANTQKEYAHKKNQDNIFAVVESKKGGRKPSCSFIFRYTTSTVRACKDTFNSSHDCVHHCCCGAAGLEIFEEKEVNYVVAG